MRSISVLNERECIVYRCLAVHHVSVGNYVSKELMRMQSHGPHKGIFISRTLYHGHAINAELSGDTGQTERSRAANAEQYGV